MRRATLRITQNPAPAPLAPPRPGHFLLLGRAGCGLVSGGRGVGLRESLSRPACGRISLGACAGRQGSVHTSLSASGNLAVCVTSSATMVEEGVLVQNSTKRPRSRETFVYMLLPHRRANALVKIERKTQRRWLAPDGRAESGRACSRGAALCAVEWGPAEVEVAPAVGGVSFVAVQGDFRNPSSLFTTMQNKLRCVFHLV